MVRLLVTVGTTRFDTLIRVVGSTRFLRAAADAGVTTLFIQHGASPIALGTIPPGMSVEMEALVSSLADQIDRADLVIGHCGSGTVLDVLRGPIFPPPKDALTRHPTLILVPNDTLMDRHQQELAEEIARQNWATVTTVEDLVDTLRTTLPRQSRSLLSVPLPPPSTDLLNSTIRSLLLQ